MYKVMVVEDSPMTRQLITFALKRLPDIRITESTNGMEAFKKLSSETFDLILTDVNMPGMDGLKLIEFLRKEPKYKETPIIVITTESAEEDKNKAMAIGATAYLPKPIQTQELLRMIHQLLRKVGTSSNLNGLFPEITPT